VLVVLISKLSHKLAQGLPPWPGYLCWASQGGERLGTMWRVPITMPRNTSLVLGPSLLPWATVTLKILHLTKTFFSPICTLRCILCPKNENGQHSLFPALPGATAKHWPQHYKLLGQIWGRTVGLCQHTLCLPISSPARCLSSGCTGMVQNAPWTSNLESG